METRANYVLIGAFALAGLIGSFVFLLWLAKIDVDRQYAYYDVLFEDVSGLGTAGDVRYNGLPIGQVVHLELDEVDPSKVRVRIEIAAKTPIKADTVAKLQSLGVTGVSSVALSGGSSDSALLPQGSVIRTERSALQTIFEGAPELIEKAVLLLEDLRSVVNEDNKSAVSDILTNLSAATARADKVMADFENFSSDVGSAAKDIAAFSDKLESLAAVAEDTLVEATGTLESIRVAADSTKGTLDNAETAFATADGLMQGELKEFIQKGADAAATLESVVSVLEPSALSTLQAAQNLVETRLPDLVVQLQETATALEGRITSLGTDASDLMSRYEEVGVAVQARVEQSASALTAFESANVAAADALQSVTQTSDTVGAMLETDIKPLATEATAALSSARALARDRLPELIDQTNTTLATIDREAQALSVSGQDLITEATARMSEARATLEAIGTTLENTDVLMTSATETSETINTLVQGDGAALVADARLAAADARAAIETVNASVQQDLPGVMENVRDAAETANRVIDSLGTEISGAADSFETLSADSSIALAAATEAFSNANGTLDAITQAMDGAVETLDTANQTFGAANQLLDEDVDAILTDIRLSTEAFRSAVTTVSGEVGEISAEILSASQSASALMATVDGLMQNNQRQVTEFLRVGLPQTVRFIEEARRMVINLDRLVSRVERDPARFLLGTQGSEFRR